MDKVVEGFKNQFGSVQSSLSKRAWIAIGVTTVVASAVATAAAFVPRKAA